LFNTEVYYMKPMTDLAAMLGERSSLTKAQIDTLMLHLQVSRGDFSLSEALSKRKGRPNQRGTHYRIVNQGKVNLVRGIFTVALAIRLGLFKQEEVARFLDAISRVPLEIGDDADDVMSLLDVLARRLVML